MKRATVSVALFAACLAWGAGCDSSEPTTDADASAQIAADAGSKPSKKAPRDTDEDAGEPAIPQLIPAQKPGNPEGSVAGAPAADSSAGPMGGASGAGASSSADAGTMTSAPAAISDIETVMMDLVYSVDAGGNPVPEPRPMILFKDGWACRNISFVVGDLDVATHKAMFPKQWVQWKVIDNKVSIQNGSNWTNLYFQQKYPPNERSRTFEDTFTHFSGATLGDVSAFSQSALHMSHDHHIVFGSFAAVTSPSTVTQSTPPDQRGTYQIDGYIIELKWDSGKVTKTSFVYSEQDAGAIYVGSVGYILEK